MDGIYPRGSVKRVKLVDFMSFRGTVVVDAGARVNLVEGANATGKSTLVTALCIGLAGSIKHLARVNRVEDLIRRGAAAFELEITLSGGANQPDIVVHRRTERTSSSGANRSRKRRRGVGGGGSGGGGGRGSGAAGRADGSEEDNSEEDDGGGAAAGGGGGGGRTCSETAWQIDGRGVKEKCVVDLSRGLGIHFGNLCQFLPQERVSAFSKLSPTELLESTEEAIADGHLLKQHKELKERSAAIKERQVALDRTQERLGRVEAEHAASAPEYQRLQRRNALRKEVERLRQKALWLDKERCKTQLTRARGAAAAVRGKLEAAGQRRAAAAAPLQARQSALQAAQQAAAAQAHEARALDGRVGRGLEALRRQEQQLQSKEELLDGLKAKSALWRADVAKTREEWERVRGERAALPTGLTPAQVARLEAVELEIQQAAGEVGPLEVQLGQKRQEVQQLAAQIRELEGADQRRQDLREQRLRKLERDLPLSGRLYAWINEMRDSGRFQRRVFGPLLMEITPMADPTAAAQLEFIAGRSNLGAVVTEHITDNDLIQGWIFEQKQAALPRHVNTNKVLLLDGNRGASAPYPHGTASQYGKYGITHTVDQLFEASSDLVKDALRMTSSIHTAFVGTGFSLQERVMEELVARTPVRRVVTPTEVANISISEWNPNHKSQKISDLSRAFLLNDDAVQGDEGTERQQLEAKRQAKAAVEAEALQLQTEAQQRQAAERALQAERAALQNEWRRLEKSAMSLGLRESELSRRLGRLQREGDPLATAETLRTALCKDAVALLQLAKDIAELVSRQHQQLRQLAVSELSLAASSGSLVPLQQAVRAAEEEVAAVERETVAATRAEERAAEKLREAEAALLEELGGRGPDAALREMWAQWPDEAEALQQLLTSKQAEMETAQAALRSDEAALMEAWRQREVEIAQLRQVAAAGSSAVETAAADVAARKSAWLPELQLHMASINEAVQGHFAAIGCAGEVVLKEEGDEYAKYAAEIRVQYRLKEPLRALNRNHHSGGERSVATMLYLMALQGVTSTPFRVVDEINQGMDSNNERRVFNLLMDCSSLADTPQCFLLTPKLISNLRFNDTVRVLSIKCTPASGLCVMPPVATQLAGVAEEHEGGGGGGAAATGGSGGRSGPSRQQQQQPGAVPRLAHLPWQKMKALLLYGRRRVRADRRTLS